MLKGVWQTDKKDEAYRIICEWIDDDKYLTALARLFEFTQAPDWELLRKIFDAAKKQNDCNTINQLVSTVSAHYGIATKDLIRGIFIPAVEILTSNNNTGWIFGFWFRPQRSEILASFELSEIQAILDNCLLVHEVDYQVEEVLAGIAERSPETVVKFFRDGIAKAGKKGSNRYTQCPSSFLSCPNHFRKSQRKLSESNGVLTEKMTGYISIWGPASLKNIFPELAEPFEHALVEFPCELEMNVRFYLC